MAATLSVWWWCKLCRKNFSNSASLGEHKMAVHPELFECKKVEKIGQEKFQSTEMEKTCERVSVIVLSGRRKEDGQSQTNYESTMQPIKSTANENRVDEPGSLDIMKNDSKLQPTTPSFPQILEIDTKLVKNIPQILNENVENAQCCSSTLNFKKNFIQIPPRTRSLSLSLSTSRPRRISFREVSMKHKRRQRHSAVVSKIDIKTASHGKRHRRFRRKIQNGVQTLSHLGTGTASKYIVGQSFGGIKLYACRLCMKLFPHLNRAYHHLHKHHPHPKLVKCQQSKRRRRIQFSTRPKNFESSPRQKITHESSHCGSIPEKKPRIENQPDSMHELPSQENKMAPPMSSDLDLVPMVTSSKLDMTPPQSPNSDSNMDDFLSVDDSDHDDVHLHTVETLDSWTIDQERAESILATCLFLTPPTSPPPVVGGHDEKSEKYSTIFDYQTAPTTIVTETIDIDGHDRENSHGVEKKEDDAGDQFSVSSIPRYCLCHQFSYGKMVACDNRKCPMKWFHFSCVGLQRSPRGKWKCPNCSRNSRK